MDSFAPSAQDRGVPGFERQDRRIHRHIGAGLINHAHNPERHSHLPYAQAVGTNPIGQDFTHGVGQAR